MKILATMTLCLLLSGCAMFDMPQTQQEILASRFAISWIAYDRSDGDPVAQQAALDDMEQILVEAAGVVGSLDGVHPAPSTVVLVSLALEGASTEEVERYAKILTLLMNG